MGMIKEFLYNHVEKLAFGIIALLCLWSIFGSITRDPNLLTDSKGKVFEYNQEETQGYIEKVKQRASSTKSFVPEPPSPPDARDIIDQSVNRGDAKLPAVDTGWLVYNKPPMPNPYIDEDIGKQVIEEVEMVPPPAAVRTRIGSPQEWEIHVGPNGILVICKDSSGTNWPADDSVNIALFRKDIGEGQENLPKERRDKFLTVTAGEKIEIQKTEEEEKTGFGGFGDFGFAPKEEETRSIAPREDTIGKFDWTLAEGMAKSESEFKTALIEAERNVSEHIRSLVDSRTMVPTLWSMKTQKMKSYDRSFLEEEIAEILKSGELPEAGAGAATTNTAGEQSTTAPATGGSIFDPFGESKDAKKSVKKESAGKDDTEESGDSADSSYPKYQPRYYAFFDNNIDENMVYRYRMIAYLKAKDLPAEIKDVPEHQTYTPYVEMAGMGARYFALHESDFIEYVKNEAKRQGALGYQPQPDKINFLENEDGEETLNPAGLRFPKEHPSANQRTPRAVKFLREDSFSLFAYTDVVLTPVKRRITLSSVVFEDDAKLKKRVFTEARIKVESIKDLDSKAKTYSYKQPLENPIPWEAFKILENNKVKLDDDFKPVLKKLEDVYDPMLADAKLVEIGQDNERVGGDNWNFATGWALVDIRQCRVVITRYNDQQRTDFKNKSSQDKPYIVVREINKKKPRYKRIIQRLSVPTDPYTLTVDWEPEFSDKAVSVMSQKVKIGKADINSWKRFCSYLVEMSKAEGDNPVKYMWKELGAEAQKVFVEATKSKPTKEAYDIMVKAINENLIGNKALYNSRTGARVYGGMDMPEALKRLIERNPRSLDELEVLLINRMLFDNVFGDFVEPFER